MNFEKEVTRKKVELELPEIIETMKLLLRLNKLKYELAIEAGFTPIQALELCKQIP